MTRLRLWILALILWFSLLFNLERFDLDGVNIVNLPGFTYIVSVLIVLAIILIDPRRYPMPLVVVPPLAIMGFWALFNPERAFGDGRLYASFTALSLLIGSALIARRIAEQLGEFSQAVESLTISEGAGVLVQLGDAERVIENEMIRSRRSQRPLSVVVVKANVEELKAAPERLIQDIQRKMATRYLLAIAARMLSQNLRRTDILVETGRPGQLVVIAPDSGRDDALALGRRIEQQLHRRLDVSTQFAIATFPDQSLTFEGLLAEAEANLRAQTPPQPQHIRGMASDQTPEEEPTDAPIYRA